MPDPAYVVALKHELEGYHRYGREDRAKDVQAELKRLGIEIPERCVEPPREKRAAPRSRARKT